MCQVRQLVIRGIMHVCGSRLDCCADERQGARGSDSETHPRCWVSPVAQCFQAVVNSFGLVVSEAASSQLRPHLTHSETDIPTERRKRRRRNETVPITAQVADWLTGLVAEQKSQPTANVPIRHKVHRQPESRASARAHNQYTTTYPNSIKTLLLRNRVCFDRTLILRLRTGGNHALQQA